MKKLATPYAIQQFLDDTPYSTDHFYRSPRRVVRDRRAHCVDGALFAASALEKLGHPPLVVDLRAVRDDDHVIAVYRVRGCWGAVAKSNVALLRYREPVYRSLRELAMSYFDLYYNTSGEKSLREYSNPVDLRGFDATGWRTRDDLIEQTIVAALDRVRHHPILTPAQIRALVAVDDRLYRAGMLGVDPDGLFAADRLKPQ